MVGVLGLRDRVLPSPRDRRTHLLTVATAQAAETILVYLGTVGEELLAAARTCHQDLAKATTAPAR